MLGVKVEPASPVAPPGLCPGGANLDPCARLRHFSGVNFAERTGPAGRTAQQSSRSPVAALERRSHPMKAGAPTGRPTVSPLRSRAIASRFPAVGAFDKIGEAREASPAGSRTAAINALPPRYVVARNEYF